MTDKKRIQKYVPRRRLPASKNRWKKPKAFRVNKVINWTAVGWLCVEVGQFVQAHVDWGANELFWPLWLAGSVAAASIIKLIDLRDEICCPDNEANE